MSDEVMISIPRSELFEAKKMIHEALHPTVTFCDDMKAMEKEAKQERERSLSLLLAWILKYIE